MATQLAGGPRYSAKVRMVTSPVHHAYTISDYYAGNWSEDEARFDLAAKDYEIRRSKGELLHLRKAREKAFQTQRSPHSYSADGCLHYGDTLMLGIDLPAGGSKTTRYFLSDNIYTQVAPGCIRVTASASSDEPQVRNTFVIERATAASSRLSSSRSLYSSKSDDNTVRYGDRIILACNPSLTVDPSTRVVGLQYLLRSQRANNVTGAGRKGRQEATMATTRNSDTEWIITDVYMDRDASDGTPVRAGEPIVLLHAMSNQALAASADETVPTDFGVELDVHVQTYKRTAHASMTHVGELPLQPAQSNNLWTFVGATSPGAAEDTRGYKPLTVEALLDRARAMIAAVCGFHGLRSLALAFASLDEKGNGLIPTESAKFALIDHGVLQTEEEFAMMLAPFNSRSFVAPAEILTAIRGDNFSRSRRGIVAAAYEAILAGKAERLSKLSATGLGRTTPAMASTSRSAPQPLTSTSAMPGTVSISELKALFDAKFDLRVFVHHTMTPSEAASEFARQWPRHQKPTDPVTMDDFMAYYEDVSSGTPDDFDFIEMVANCWHVPGHGNWKAKKGKKVLVTFHKGSSAEVVVPECEDIADDDFEGLSTALKSMGFGGIARVKVLGIVDPE